MVKGTWDAVGAERRDGSRLSISDLGGLCLRDQQIHHLEVPHPETHSGTGENEERRASVLMLPGQRREVHVYEDLVAAAVQHKACARACSEVTITLQICLAPTCRGQRGKEPLDEVRIET